VLDLNLIKFDFKFFGKKHRGRRVNPCPISAIGMTRVTAGADRTQPVDLDSAGRVHRWARIPTDERG
jgi:hypothetical protein